MPMRRRAASRMTGGADRGAAMSGLVPGDFGWMSHMLRGDFESAWRLADADRERRRRAGITGADWPRHMRPVWDGGELARRARAGALLSRARRHDPVRPLSAAAGRARGACPRRGAAGADPAAAQPAGQSSISCRWEDRIIRRRGSAATPRSTSPSCRMRFAPTLGTIPAAIPYLQRRAGAVGGGGAASRRGAGAVAGRACLGRRGLEAGALGSARPACRCSARFPVSRWSICSAARNIDAGARRRRALPMIEVFDTDAIADTAATIANLDLVDHGRYDGRASRRRARRPGMADAAFRRRLALAARPLRQPVVPDDAPVPAEAARRLGRRRRRGRGRASTGKLLINTGNIAASPEVVPAEPGFHAKVRHAEAEATPPGTDF